jgi:hypothetical protein|nr:hypothetical protein [uncultured Lachnoclostridium sp.]
MLVEMCKWEEKKLDRGIIVGKKIGIVVTIENYRTSENSSSCIKPVKYATSDGESIKKMFQENLGISQEDIFYFKDEQATLATFNGEIQYYIKI